MEIKEKLTPRVPGSPEKERKKGEYPEEKRI